MTANHHYTLRLSCPDRIGIVAAISSFVAGHGGWITEASHHADPELGRFFMRQEIRAESLPFDIEVFRERFLPIAQTFNMDWQIIDSARKKRVVILVSRLGHCLYDLLARWRAAEWAIEIPCVISNHNTYRGFVEWHGIPFHHVEVSADNSTDAHHQIGELIAAAEADVTVLARYMQVLPAFLCDRYPGRIINIHHGFLPSFRGAKPYHQAYERGVKLVGATCHYVTPTLDEGPIIEQDVVRVDHSDEPDDLVRYGRDIERTVLARGLGYHLDDRVIIHGQKTVVFR